ncbi:P-loop containing nucleoside triphosphate hydrolase protein [Glomus cerebriforme]|uniref:P-loop containing nucleoside triphosphate hydrolase protein n=1 Tax=Glomus cerebriforme TaxID=658196 RepID=A0A397SQL0_9GLOM|nr:P-loop containing nucleoside triphosphate hydrolase protein [Glomus cerebriforme]
MMSRYFLPFYNRIFSLAGTNSLFFKKTPNSLLIRNFTSHYAKKASAKESQTNSSLLRDFSGISKHYIPKEGEVLNFLNRYHVYPKPATNAETKRIKCPNCRPKKSNYYSATINLKSGVYNCQVCMKKGNWGDYVQLVSKTDSFQIINATNLGFGRFSFSRSQSEIEEFPNALLNNPEIIENFTKEHGITLNTLQEYKVGIAKYHNINPASNVSGRIGNSINAQRAEEMCFTFPRTAPFFDDSREEGFLDSKITRIKACSIKNDELVAFDPPSSVGGLFGYHLAKLECDTIILTGNEFDAMAVYQETNIPATCLPNNVYQLPLEVLPLFERFSKIYLWLDDDVEGQGAAEKFAQKLGIDRCLIVNTRCGRLNGPINASQALATGQSLLEILYKSKPLQHDQIIDFEGIKEAVYREIANPAQVCGVLSKDLPGLNKILKGHRPGEITIFTGPTGTGKTTILSQLSLDYCRSGVSTLWGSFEIPNVRLAKKMLQQFAEKDLTKYPEEFVDLAEKFQQLPMYFLKFYGSTEISTIIDAMDHAIHAFDVRHIIIDNLQFMTADQGRYIDRWELHDRILTSLRRVATEKNVHITIVVHPKKDDKELLDVSSVFGTAKVTQEADNVIILQRLNTENGDVRLLDIRKNRFDGTLAAIPIEFEVESLKIKQTRNNRSVQS